MTTNLSPLSGSPVPIKNESSHHSPNTNQVTVIAHPVIKPATKSKPRKRVNTAEKRHQHNAIERQRRETLNGKFLTLARLLPSLAKSRRPSKSAIVNGSIAHLTYQRDQRLLATKLLRQLSTQHDLLLNEVNEWRKASGFPSKEVGTTWTAEMDEVCLVEKEVFGNFTTVDGDDNDNDDDDMNDMSFEQNVMASLGSLVTPRSSADTDAMSNAAVNMFIDQPRPQPQAAKMAPTVNGFNWSQEFAFNSMSSSSSALPFNAFMSDTFDQSSTGSPANSLQGNVLTPPTTGDVQVHTQTPSPRSSYSAMDNKVAPPAVPNWTEQQMMFLRATQPPPLPLRQQSIPAMTSANHFNQSSNNAMYNLFAQQAQAPVVPHTQSILPAASGSDTFTQSLLASMFPSQGVSVDQVDQWRRLALSGLNSQTVNSVPNAPHGSGMSMNTVWQGQGQGQGHAVEGF